jgi:glycosyltransferase involved in cell wall biosynthesis
VILPTWNRAGTLMRAISSVLAQDYGRFELLVIDDGSTDGTEALVRGIPDARIRYLRQDRNRGVAAARNRGMAEAGGSLLAFLDSDDAWMPGKLGRQVARMQAAAGRVGLIHTGLLIRGEGDSVETWRPGARGMVLSQMLRTNVVHFGTSSTMIRAEAAAVVGGFDTTLPANEDHDFWTRIARFYEVDFDPEPLAIYDLAGDTPGAGAKRSTRFERNAEARDRFVTEHGFEARRLGAISFYQMDSARRHLELEDGRARAGRWLLLKAASAAPLRPQPWIWLGLSILPRKARIRAATGLRAWRDGASRGATASPEREA